MGSAAGPGGFAQGRIRDGPGDLSGVGVRPSAGKVKRNDVGDAFAVVNDAIGEVVADVGERGAEAGLFARRSVFPACAGCAAAEQEHGVVGAGIAVDGDAVEGGVGGGFEQSLEGRCLNPQVGKEINQHGGVGCAGRWTDIGADHAGTFAAAEDADRFAADHHFRLCHFHARVGGQDRGGEGFRGGLRALKSGDRDGQGRDELVHGQRDADDAG